MCTTVPARVGEASGTVVAGQVRVQEVPRIADELTTGTREDPRQGRQQERCAPHDLRDPRHHPRRRRRDPTGGCARRRPRGRRRSLIQFGAQLPTHHGIDGCERLRAARPAWSGQARRGPPSASRRPAMTISSASPGPRTSGPVPADQSTSVATSRTPRARHAPRIVGAQRTKSNADEQPLGGDRRVMRRAPAGCPAGESCCRSTRSCRRSRLRVRWVRRTSEPCRPARRATWRTCPPPQVR